MSLINCSTCRRVRCPVSGMVETSSQDHVTRKPPRQRWTDAHDTLRRVSALATRTVVSFPCVSRRFRLVFCRCLPADLNERYIHSENRSRVRQTVGVVHTTVHDRLKVRNVAEDAPPWQDAVYEYLRCARLLTLTASSQSEPRRCLPLCGTTTVLGRAPTKHYMHRRVKWSLGEAATRAPNSPL